MRLDRHNDALEEFQYCFEIREEAICSKSLKYIINRLKTMGLAETHKSKRGDIGTVKKSIRVGV